MNVERVECNKLDNNNAINYAKKVVKYYFNKNISKTKYLGGGSFGRVVLITFEDKSKVVVKFILTDGMLEKETHDINLLRENCSVRMPKIITSRKKR